MDAIEAPEGFELETWVEMVGHGEPFPYYHYYARRQGAEGVLEVYEAGGCGWRPRLESAGPWPRVAEAYEQLVAADARKPGFAEIVDPARRPRGFTKGMYGSPQTPASPRAFCHLVEASVEEAVRRYGDSEPERWSEDDWRDPRIDVRKLLNREIYAETLRCCLAGHYRAPSGQRIRLPGAEEAADKTWGYVRSRPIGPDVPRVETTVTVAEQDCVAAGKALLDAGLRPAVLNLANRQHPGGGVIGGARAQEEGLFRRSTLALSLYPFDRRHADFARLPLRKQFYPLDRNEGSIHSRDVVFFRGREAEDAPFLEAPFMLDVVTVPAINRPTLVAPEEICPEHAEATKRKMRAILRACFHGGNDAIVLGAFGCGAFHNPPAHIARLSREVFEEPEFCGVFRRLVFAILDDHNARHAHNPDGNLLPFQRVFC